MGERRKTGANAARGSAAPNAQRRPTRAELIWDGKYDAAGRRVAPLRVALPFQTVETVNESAQDRQRSLVLGPGFREEEWRNRLIWGDKKYVLPSLLAEFVGNVNLIYIDPPFDTGADFSFTATVPHHPEAPGDDSFTFTKEPSIIEQKAYRDTWGRGLESYLHWIYETAVLLHELLHETGSIYVHVGSNVSYLVRTVLDEVFGRENLINEITWKRSHAHGDTGQGATHFGRITEAILIYHKGDKIKWTPQYSDYTDAARDRDYKYIDENGERYRLMPVDGPGGAAKGNPYYEFLGVKGFWRYSKETMQDLYDAGEIVVSSTGKSLSRKRLLKDAKGTPVTDLWDDVNRISPTSSERLDYPTQKPEALLRRIINTSSDKGDLVLDCFCGSGTTAGVAEKLGRRWIACDLGRFAIHTTRKRLLSIPGVRPFVVQNLGKYERQLWAGAEFGEANGHKAAERQRAYVEFVLKLAQATPLHGYTWLHGVKAGRMLHISAVDAPVSVGEVTQIAAEFRRAVGTGKDAPTTNGVDVLGWDFAFELNEVARQQAAAAKIQMRFLRIPRDVMDKRAVEQGDIHFFELAALSVEAKTNKRNVYLKLNDFVIPPDDGRRRRAEPLSTGCSGSITGRSTGTTRATPSTTNGRPTGRARTSRSRWRSCTPTRIQANTRSS
jgi:adenine-specific DNA-methyltransferase